MNRPTGGADSDLTLAPTGGVALVAVLGMAVVTYITRAGGLWLMSRVALTAGVASFLRHLSGCVLVAIIVPAAVVSDFPAHCGLGATLIAMAWSRRALLAMGCGVVTTAVVRAIVGL